MSGKRKSKAKEIQSESQLDLDWVALYRTYATPAVAVLSLLALFVGIANGRGQKDLYDQLKASQQETAASLKVEKDQTLRSQAELTESIRQEIRAEVAKIDSRAQLQSLNQTVEKEISRVGASEEQLRLLSPFVFSREKQGTTAFLKKAQIEALKNYVAASGYEVQTSELKKPANTRHPAFAPPGAPEEWVQVKLVKTQPKAIASKSATAPH